MNVAFYEQLARWSQVAGSAVFIAVLVYVFVRFIQPAIIAAQEHKNAELEDAVGRRDAAAEDVKVAERELETVSQYCEAIRERGERDARRERERIAAEAAGEGERIVRNAEGELERARAGAREMLRHELVAKAVEIARANAARLDAEANRRLVANVVHTALREGA